VRLWPIAETLGASPRILGDTEGTGIGQIWRDLFGTEGSHLSQVWRELTRRHRPNPPHAEYYVGIASLPIFLVGCLRRRALPFILSGLLWVWLSLGYRVTFPLFALLRMVPPFTMLRAPERVLPLFVLDAGTAPTAHTARDPRGGPRSRVGAAGGRDARGWAMDSRGHHARGRSYSHAAGARMETPM
jgi:hypothetical protein